MFKRKVLDKGYVKLLNISGAIPRDSELLSDDHKVDVANGYHEFAARDTDPALVARGSFDQAFLEKSKELDEGLCEYLIRNEHTTPLEFTTIHLQFKMPIFVARQFVRHRTGNPAENNTGNEPTVNEVSGRYVTLPEDWYIPEVVRGKHSGGNKQGSEDNLREQTQLNFKRSLEEQCNESFTLHLQSLQAGVCPEQARMFLHLNHYTSFVWKQDLHNLMHLLALRLDEHAQWEARQYAEAIYSLLREHLPKSMEWFDEYRRKLDFNELADIRNLIKVLEDLGYQDNSELGTLRKLAKRQGIKL